MRYASRVRRIEVLAAAVAAGVSGLVALAATDTRGPILGAADAAGRVAFWGLVLASGARVAGRITGSRLTGLSHLAWDGGAGLALVSAVLLVVGLVPGGFRETTVRCVLAAIVAAGGWLGRKDPLARFRRGRANDGSADALLLLLVLVAVASLFWDRVPPVFFDARAYHFALPEMSLIDGRVAPQPWSLHSWFPPGMSTLYGAGLACGGERWANDANAVVGLCLIAMAFDLARRLFGSAAGALAGVLVATLPLFLYALAIPAADLGHGMFVFGTLGSLLLRSEDDPSWLQRAAILCGGALLTKYLGMLAPLMVGAVWLGITAKRGRAGAVIRFAGPALLMVLPWLAANAWIVGNPVAPAGASILSTKGLAPGGAELFRGDARGGLPSVADFRRLGTRWITGDEEDSRFYPTPAWGWLPLALLPLALPGARDDRSIRTLFGLSGGLIAIWLVTYRWERFLIAAATCACAALAGGVVALSRRLPALRMLPAAVGALAVAAAAMPLSGIAAFVGGADVAAGRQAADEWIARALPVVRLFRRVDATLDPSSDRVLLVGEMRHYGLSLPRCAPTGFNVHPLAEALRADPSPAAANRALRAAGFTHLLVDPGWTARSAAQYPSLAPFREHPEILERYLATLGEPLVSQGSLALFRIPG